MSRTMVSYTSFFPGRKPAEPLRIRSVSHSLRQKQATRSYPILRNQFPPKSRNGSLFFLIETDNLRGENRWFVLTRYYLDNTITIVIYLKLFIKKVMYATKNQDSKRGHYRRFTRCSPRKWSGSPECESHSKKTKLFHPTNFQSLFHDGRIEIGRDAGGQETLPAVH
jgi:hypothetical protein